MEWQKATWVRAEAVCWWVDWHPGGHVAGTMTSLDKYWGANPRLHGAAIWRWDRIRVHPTNHDDEDEDEDRMVWSNVSNKSS